MLIGSRNLFHGNASPPGPRAHLEEMVRLATVDRQDVVVLQEVPHIAVRGAGPSPLRVWPDGRRRRDGMLLSDHPPIELDL